MGALTPAGSVWFANVGVWFDSFVLVMVSVSFAELSSSISFFCMGFFCLVDSLLSLMSYFFTVVFLGGLLFAGEFDVVVGDMFFF